jgi:ATP/maltotriose-dependent transcriptional regulator MalT
VEAAAQTVLLRSEIYTFRGWLSRLPEAEVSARPNLILFYAWVLVMTDSPPESVEAWLNKVDLGSERTAAKVGVIRGYQAFMLGEIMRATILLQGSLPGLPAEETLFRGVVTWLLSLAHVVTGDFQTGSQALKEVIQTSLQKKQLSIAAGASCALAEIALRLGQLQAAHDNYQAALSIARDAQGRLPVAARALMGLSDVWREWNDLDQAIRDCSEGIELAKQLRESAAIAGYITLARIQQGLGEASLAQVAMQKAWELARQTEATGLDDLYVGVYQANLAIKQGDLEAVGRWMNERGLTGEFNPEDLDQKDDYYKYHLLKYELLVAAAGGSPSARISALPAGAALTRMEAQDGFTW